MQCEVPLVKEGAGRMRDRSSSEERKKLGGMRRRTYRALSTFVPCVAPSRSSQRSIFASSSGGDADKLTKGIELALSALFGAGAWLTVNGVFVELPLLVRAAPEGWALPSHLSLAIQSANVGPILYLVLLRYCSRARTFAARAYATYTILTLGALASLALAFTWDKPVGGRSWPIMVLTFFFALVGCTSSVLFIPFMASFRTRSLAAYFTGEGIGGLLPGIIALVQGVGGEGTCIDGKPNEPEPLFSSTVYFCCLFALMVCSIIGFGFLERKGGGGSAVEVVKDESDYPETGEGERDERSAVEGPGDEEQSGVDPPPLGTIQLYILLAIAFWVCFMANGALPGIQSYSCGPYGNIAYHLSAILSAMANPATCLVAFFTPLRNTFSLSNSTPPHIRLCILLGIAALAATVLTGLATTTAAMSPSPPLIGTTTGEVLIVLIWIGLTIGAVYAKVGVAGALQEADSMQHGKATGRGPLLWYGAFTQAGSAIGSLLAFLAVSEWNLFVAHPPC